MLHALAHTISAVGSRLRARRDESECSRRLDLAELEDRVLYSASPLPIEALGGADDAGGHPSPELWPDFSAHTDVEGPSHPDVHPAPDAGTIANELAMFEPAGHQGHHSASDAVPEKSHDPALEPQVGTTVIDAAGHRHDTAASELIFVDTAVDHYQQLVAELLAERNADRAVEVILLHGDRDGVEQITEQLANHDDLHAVRILSHGTVGKVKLGNVWLSAGNVGAYAGELAKWGNSLAHGADLLFYGCDLAANQHGHELIEAISVLTGADVAVSVDATGHDALGGDWDLEYTTGPIETGSVFSHPGHESWHGLLAAPVIVVDTMEDAADGDTSSIASLLADRGADGLISLREAIIAANNTPNGGGIDEIHFDIGGGGTRTIQPLTALPTITDPVILDGTTQPGHSGAPIIELDGSLTSGVDGLLITGGNSTVRGLVINRFDGDGIHLAGAGGNVIEGNYIGTNVAGNATLANSGDGIEITSANNTIGGTAAGSHNVIAGNGGNGIRIDGPAAFGNTVLGNSIGTDSSGSLDLGNAGAGIRIANSSGNTVGGVASGAGNTIAYNREVGVAVEQGVGNTVRGNALYDNGGLGIDLGADGVTTNDPGDGDAGGNDLQNYPTLDLAIVSASEIVINGTFSGTPNTTFEIDFYSSGVGDPSDHGEGETLLGSMQVTTDAGGHANFSTLLTGVATSAGDRISATATDPSGNTSEFSQNVTVALDDPTIPDAALVPEIDGNVDDIWSASSPHVIRNVTIGSVSGAGDLLGTWKGLWDPDNLYLLVDVTDDMLVDDTGPADPWMDDMVEVFIDADFSQQSTYDGVNDFHFGFRWNDAAVYTGPNSVPDTSGITFQMVATPTGYRLEAAIPWATLGVFPASGDAIGMDVEIADDDDGGARDGKLAWYATSEIAYQDPSSFARVEVLSDRNGSLWLSTSGDVASPSGVATLDSWVSGDALQFANPRLQFEPGTTEGTLSIAAALDDLADDGDANIDAMHYVTRDITIGGAASVDLLEGDLLLSTADDEAFTSTNSLSVADEDLFLFRPDVPGDYRSGTFLPVLNGLNTLFGVDELSGISLIERDTTVGDATLLAGDFLLARPGAAQGNDIYLFHTVGAGQGTTDGTVSLLIEGSDIGIDGNMAGLELVEQSVEIGGHIFPAGHILATLDSDDGNLGNHLIFAKAHDVVALDFTATTLMAGTAAADAEVVFEGGDVGLDAVQENPDALSLVHLGNSPTADIGGPYAIGEGDPLALDASNSTDPDGDLLFYAWDLDNDGVYGDVSGESPIVDWAQLQSHGIVDQGTYPIAVLVRDGTGGVDWATTTLSVADTPPTLTTTGDSVFKVGKPYTLQLSATDPGDDTISAWTIDWGDGTIETLAGNPTTATHTYAQAGFTYNILASATNEEGTFHQHGLLVPGRDADSVFRFAPTTADFLDEFGAADGLNQPYEAVVGPDGNLYVSGDGGNHVLRFDATTGAFIDEFVAAGSGGLQNAHGLAFGPDGNLYVSSYGTDEVLRFDGSTGALLDVFVPAGRGGLDGPGDLIFGPDGNLYVGSSLGDSILRYNGTTGAFIDEFVAAGSGGLDGPVGITSGPDGNLYVASGNSNNVLRYDGTTGAFLGEFVTAGSGGLAQAAGLKFGPDGNLYVSSVSSDSIIRYDGTTGAVIDQFVPTGRGGLQSPAVFEFVPGHQVAIVTNWAPVANAGGPYAINETDSITLDASGSVDPDGDPLTYSWDIDNDGTFGDVTGQSLALSWAQLAGYGIADDGTYTIGVQVNDGDGGIDTDWTTITVNNLAPTATDDAGAAFTTDEDTSFTTANVLTNDTDANPADTLSVTGIDTTGTVGIVIDNGDGTFAYDPNGQFDSLSVSQQATDTFTYTVSDDDGGSNSATVAITIAGANDAPTASDAAFAAAENAAEGTVVATVSASDVDTGDTLAYSITSGNVGGAFAINSATGDIAVADGSALDFETTPTYHLTIEVQDAGGLADTASVAINLGDVNEAPTASDATFALDENSADGTTAGTVLASDPDMGDSLAYSIVGGNADGALAVDIATGEIAVANSSAIDFEATPTFALTIQVQDARGLVDTASVTIDLNDVNEAPTAGDAVLAVAENSGSRTPVGLVSASDPDAGDTLTYAITSGNTNGAFAIDSATGEILVANSAALDFETVPAFDLTVAVQDGGGLTDAASVAITVADVNEAPTAQDASFDLPETSPHGSHVGTVTAADADAGDAVVYSIVDGNDAGAFAIDPVTGEITVADSSRIDFETAPTFDLTISAQDSGGLTATARITIDLSDVNEGPALADAAFSLDVNSSNGAAVGTIAAVDPDAGDALSYAIVDGNPGGIFAIDGRTGQIILASSDALDIESVPTITLTVQVEDAGGLVDSAEVTIRLRDEASLPTAISDQERHAGSPEHASQSLWNNANSLSPESGLDAAATSHRHLRLPAASATMLSGADRAAVGQPSHGRPSILHVEAPASRAEIRDGGAASYSSRRSARGPSDATHGTVWHEVTFDSEPAGENREKGGSPPGNRIQADSNSFGSLPDAENADVPLKQRALSSNLIAAASISSCYLLSTIPAGGKLAVAKGLASVQTVGSQAASQSTLATQAIGTTLTHDSRTERAASDEPKSTRRKRTKPTPKEQVNAQQVGRKADDARPSPPADCNPYRGGPDEQLESGTDRSPKETPLHSPFRLAAVAGAAFRRLRSCLTRNAPAEDKAAEEHLRMERRLDHFLQAPAGDSSGCR